MGQGADDYLTKPFDGRELTARIAVLLRRPTVLLPIDVLKVGDIELDAKAHKVTRGGSLVSLLPKEFALLEFFMRNAGQYFPAEKLLAHVWPSESDSTVEALTSCIKRLRQKIDYSGSESVIKNVRGAGYGLFVENQNS
ncbi:MAG: Transcriptional regulatory protein CusR [bacterium ADurb.Bin425]|nr:MAG: Transcriptional regulatory protein CusR [bacterium ADurb.Bin425]